MRNRALVSTWNVTIYLTKPRVEMDYVSLSINGWALIFKQHEGRISRKSLWLCALLLLFPSRPRLYNTNYTSELNISRQVRFLSAKPSLEVASTT